MLAIHASYQLDLRRRAVALLELNCVKFLFFLFFLKPRVNFAGVIVGSMKLLSPSFGKVSI